MYKNSARVGSYVDCNVNVIANSGIEMSVSDAVKQNREMDCILPFGVSSTCIVTPCFLGLKVCDEKGIPSADAVRSVSPEVFIRTDRGSWSAFHESTCYLLPVGVSSFKLQIATKERSNVMRAAIVLRFSSGSTTIATSDILIVLSKPPAAHKDFPFARIVPGDGSTKKCSPSRWLSFITEKHTIVPEKASSTTRACLVHALGSYRTSIPITLPKSPVLALSVKRQRSEEIELPIVNLEAETLRIQLHDMQQRLIAVEAERAGLAKALRLLN